MLQVNCADLAKYDTDHLLPDHGLLLFFYSMASEVSGDNPTEKDAARVYWFEDLSALAPIDEAAVPKDYQPYPITRISASQEMSLPTVADYFDIDQTTYEEYEAAEAELDIDEERVNSSRMLGWPVPAQGSMNVFCELLEQGYDITIFPRMSKSRPKRQHSTTGSCSCS